jgi:hypothetical protein
LWKASFVQPVSGDVFSSGDVIQVEWQSVNMPLIGVEIKRVAGGKPELVSTFCRVQWRSNSRRDGETFYRGWFALHLDKLSFPAGTAYELKIVHPEWNCGYHTTGIYHQIRIFVF